MGSLKTATPGPRLLFTPHQLVPPVSTHAPTAKSPDLAGVCGGCHRAKAGRVWFFESPPGREPADCFFFEKERERKREKK